MSQGVEDERVRALRVLARLARLLDRSTGELPLSQYRVLAAIADGDERASRVAERLAIGKPTVSAAVDSLTRQGLISRTGEAEDGRATRLALTAAGESALAEVEARLLEHLDDLFDRTEDPAAAVAGLASLGGPLDEVAGERLAARAAKRGRVART